MVNAHAKSASSSENDRQGGSSWQRLSVSCFCLLCIVSPAGKATCSRNTRENFEIYRKHHLRQVHLPTLEAFINICRQLRAQNPAKSTQNMIEIDIRQRINDLCSIQSNLILVHKSIEVSEWLR